MLNFLNKQADLPINSYVPPHGTGSVVASFRENLAGNLRRILKQRHMRQRDLAEKIGLSEPAISGWMSMRDWPSPENLDKAAAALGVTPEELFRDATSASLKRNSEAVAILREIADRFGLEVKKKN